MGGLTYGAVKSTLSEVCENGLSPTDTRVLKRTNEATAILLQELVPVGGMLTADIVADGTTLLLPKEFENSIEVEIQGAGNVDGNIEHQQGWYDIINPSTYVDPQFQHDSPLVDQFLQPDPDDDSILRRQYDFPGLTPNATVRVTGAKRYIPLTDDSDFLIIQNIDALKSMILSLERKYNCNDPDGAAKYKAEAIGILQAEVKKHLLDPKNSLKRRAGYEADLENYIQDTFGWVRARLALELPNGLTVGKYELTRMLEDAERKLIGKVQAVGTWEEFTADVVGGHIFLPTRVQSIIAMDLCGYPIDVRNVMFEYIRSGPGKFCGCGEYLIDEGDVQYADGTRRRSYRLRASTTTTQTITFLTKLRWVKKIPTDFMTIKNFEALKLAAEGNQAEAIAELDKELNEWLGGQAPVVNLDLIQLGGCGSML